MSGGLPLLPEAAPFTAEQIGALNRVIAFANLNHQPLTHELAENVLAEQPFVKDPSKTVGELLRDSHGGTAVRMRNQAPDRPATGTSE